MLSANFGEERQHRRDGEEEERRYDVQPTVLPQPLQFNELVKHSQVRSTCSSSVESGQNVSVFEGRASVEKRTM